MIEGFGGAQKLMGAKKSSLKKGVRSEEKDSSEVNLEFYRSLVLAVNLQEYIASKKLKLRFGSKVK